MKARDLFQGSSLLMRRQDTGWLISIRSADGHVDPLSVYAEREDALEAVDAWMEALDDETELVMPPVIGNELRSLMIEVLRNMANGEIKRGELGVDDKKLERWFKEQMGE